MIFHRFIRTLNHRFRQLILPVLNSFQNLTLNSLFRSHLARSHVISTQRNHVDEVDVTLGDHIAGEVIPSNLVLLLELNDFGTDPLSHSREESVELCQRFLSCLSSLLVTETFLLNLVLPDGSELLKACSRTRFSLTEIVGIRHVGVVTERRYRLRCLSNLADDLLCRELKTPEISESSN